MLSLLCVYHSRFPNPLCPSPRGGLYHQHFVPCRMHMSRQKNFPDDNACPENFFDPAGNLDMYIRHGSRQSERHGRRKPQTPEGLWLDLTSDTGRIYAHAAVGGGFFSHSLLPLPGRSVCLPRRIPCASVAEPVCSVKGRKIFFKDSQKVLKFVMLRKSSLKKFFLAFGKPLTEQPEPASCAQWVYDDGKAYGSCSERQVERMRKKE